MKIPFPLRKSLNRQTLTLLYMLMLVALTFLLAAASTFAADNCIELVPFKQLGSLKIGDPVPSALDGIQTEVDSRLKTTEWHIAGPYRFRTDKGGHVDYIQYTLQGEKTCLRLGGRRLQGETSAKKLKAAFPNCRHEAGLPFDILNCEGLQLGLSPGPRTVVFRVDVGDEGPAEQDARRAAEAVSRELLFWWPKKLPSPVRQQ